MKRRTSKYQIFSTEQRIKKLTKTISELKVLGYSNLIKVYKKELKDLKVSHKPK